MDRIEWSAGLSVGVEEIDGQHQRLIAIINRLVAHREDGMNPDEMFAVISDLVDYSDYHFRTEDNYMMEIEYPLFLSHRKEHLAYIKKMSTLITALENKEPNLVEEMLTYLTQWWKHHIIESDQRYARYVKAQKKT